MIMIYVLNNLKMRKYKYVKVSVNTFSLDRINLLFKRGYRAKYFNDENVIFCKTCKHVFKMV